MTSAVDVLVAGGGPAGAAAALVLARAGRSVLVVDAARERDPSCGESLPPAAWPLLATLGLSERIAAEHLRTPGTLSAWGSDELVARDFVRELHGHGLQLDRAAFDAAVLDQAGRAGARIATGARVLDVAALPAGDATGACHAVRVAGGGAFTARWIVDATGRRALAARRLGARRVRDDALVAMLAEFRAPHGGDRDSRLVIEACRDSWWYSALTPSGKRIVGLLADPDLTDLRAAGTPAGFEARLATTVHIAPRLRAHGYALAGGPRSTSAAGGCVAPWRGPGWIAVGDAALAFDPLSSQGIFHALYTGLRGAEAVAAALDGNDAPLADHDRRLAEIRAAYLHHRAAVYASEPRWADQPFWRRRSAAAP